MIVKFRVEDGLKAFMADPEFKQRIIRAYEVQVEQNGGWGFTVTYKGYKIRFDLVESSVKGLLIYEGYMVEEPKNVQKTLLEVLT